MAACRWLRPSDGRIARRSASTRTFPEFIRQAGQGHADLLIVPANEWKAIKEIHAQMAAFRAIENGVSLIRPAASGISSAFDPWGRVLGVADYFAPGRSHADRAGPRRRRPDPLRADRRSLCVALRHCDAWKPRDRGRRTDPNGRSISASRARVTNGLRPLNGGPEGPPPPGNDVATWQRSAPPTTSSPARRRDACFRNLSAHGMKYFQFGPSVWPPSCWRQASWPSSRPTFTAGIFSVL